jgi:serine/threonine protein kinase
MNLRPRKSTHRLFQDYMDEVVIWRYTRHPNIVPFIGTYCLFAGRLTLVSEWMQNGTIMSFLKAHPEEHRRRYVSIV